ncbi:MAG: acyltransferase [Burkholderiales bacterium]|nr:acyltransferase [Burkholderiales bacterium]
MRAIAALLVMYDHLVGIWLQRSRVEFAPALFADRWLFEPLHVMAHGGSLAVAIFFLVSGFVIVYVAQRESHREFGIRRLLRIYPPLWLSMALLLIAYGVALSASDAPGLRGYAIERVLAEPNPVPYILVAMTLGNYLIDTPTVNGVAWTLIIEVLFYLCVLLLLPLLKSRPRTALATAFAALALLQVVARSNSVVFLLAVNGVYVSYLFLGSVIYFRWAGRIGNHFFALATVAFASLFLHGVREFIVQPPLTFSGYGVSYLLAWLCFVILLLMDDRIRLGRISTFFSRISYSLYLNHGGLGLLALTLLHPWLGYPVSLVLTFALVVAISAASHRWIEVPSQHLARRLTASTRS